MMVQHELAIAGLVLVVILDSSYAYFNGSQVITTSSATNRDTLVVHYNMCLNSEPFRVLSSVQAGDKNSSLKLNATVTEALPSAFRVVLERTDGMPGWDLNSVTIIWTLYMKSDIQNCQDLYEVGERKSGIYKVYLEGSEAEVKVFCDMETDGGGWTVFQRRTDGSLSFDRNWSQYTAGFGNLNAEFWLGLDFLEFSTEKGNFELRIDMTGCLNKKKYAQYTSFKIGGTNYFFPDLPALLRSTRSVFTMNILSLHSTIKAVQILATAPRHTRQAGGSKIVLMRT
uniref:fibrinogen-like protein 1-like protein n=1 Tax=Ciona intestinalis TaxID=7719 RepID=UPI00089DD2E5|nr:fibrinogen-like protein 1-like protein [Ciona intestinalis]|eukprot:XP_018673211.1 fibrinogen-like protein 1-like protein [Ciona intestinalis]